MSISPTGMLSVPSQAAKTVLQNCVSWQTWLGCEKADDPTVIAGEHVSFVEIEEVEENFPSILVSLPRTFHADLLDEVTVKDNGSIKMLFKAVVPEEYKGDSDAAIWFSNNVGAVMEEFATIAFAQGWLVRGVSYDESDGPTRAHGPEETAIDLMEWLWTVEYGLV